MEEIAPKWVRMDPTRPQRFQKGPVCVLPRDTAVSMYRNRDSTNTSDGTLANGKLAVDDAL